MYEESTSMEVDLQEMKQRQERSSFCHTKAYLSQDCSQDCESAYHFT